MMVLGTQEHFDDIKRMSMDFFYASPYSELGVSEDRVEELIQLFLDSKVKDRIILLWVKEKPVGILAATAETNIFNRFRFAGELIWWIDPEHRTGRAASEMLKAYEYWARQAGCQSAALVDLMGNLDNYYKRKGYERRETSYLKVF